MRPLVSVVIPCLNAAATLERQLDAVLGQQGVGSFEVIVADNRSTDSSRDIAARYESVDDRVRIVDASRARGVSVARNEGVRAALGDLIVLCDSDDAVQPGWLQAYAVAAAAGASVMAGGLDRTLADGEVVSRDRGLFQHPWPGHPWGAGANCAFTREAFEAIGGFDEQLRDGSDDNDFFWRLGAAGYVPVAVPDAVVTYVARTHLSQVFSQYAKYGRASVSGYQKWRYRGLPRDSIATVLMTLAHALSLLVTSGRRVGIQELGYRWGRLAGSVRTRTLYL